jgi:hypothetical protein
MFAADGSLAASSLPASASAATLARPAASIAGGKTG